MSHSKHIIRKSVIVGLSFAVGVVSTVFAAATYDANIQNRANTLFTTIKSNASKMDPSTVPSYYTLVRTNIASLIQVLTTLDSSIAGELGLLSLPGLDDGSLLGQVTGTGNSGTTNNSTNTNTSTNNATSTGIHMGTSTTPTEANCIALGKELAYVNGILACKATGGSCALAGKVLSGDTCVVSCPNNKTAPTFTNTCQETSLSCSAIGKVLSGTTCIDSPVTTGENFNPQCGPVTKHAATKSLGGAFWNTGSASGSTNFTPGLLCDESLIKGYVSNPIKDSLINIIDGDGSDGVLNWNCYGMSNGKKDTTKSINCSVTKINTRIVTDTDLGLPGTSQYPMYDSIAKWEAAGSHGTQSKTAICNLLGYEIYTRGAGSTIECSIDGKVKSLTELNNIKARWKDGEYEITYNGNEPLWYDIKWGGVLKPVYDFYINKIVMPTNLLTPCPAGYTYNPNHAACTKPTKIALDCKDQSSAAAFYNAYLNRCGETAGLNYWNEQIVKTSYADQENAFKVSAKETIGNLSTQQYNNSFLCDGGTYLQYTNVCKP